MFTAQMHTNPAFKLNRIQFDGDQLSVVEKDGKYFVALKPLCDFFKLDWSGQYKNIKNDAVLNSTLDTTSIVAQDGKQREMLCIPLEYLNGWLFKINPIRYEGERREKIIRYQKECYQVLHNHFFPHSKEQMTQLKSKVTAKRLELALIKAEFAMKKQAEEIAKRIFKGNGTIEDLNICPDLQAMTTTALNKLNEGDLFKRQESDS